MDPIAIVGIGCRFPGDGNNPENFWKNLCEGKDAIVDIPNDRWDVRRFYDENQQAPGKMYVKKGGFLNEKWENFDADFFHFSPREADFLDPQQRLLLELTWEAFEDGGIVPDSLRNSNSGVFVGAFTTDWQSLNNSPYNLDHCETYSGINSSMTILSARLSHFFDLKGPCLTVDTACSSSLVAIHLACQSLWHNECSLAIAGGINAMLIPQTTIAMSKGKFLNPEGRCKSFSNDAMGYIRGEGGGVLVLKKLSEAIKDGNDIYSVIRGTGINHDGYTQGIAQPNPKAQKDLIQKVLKESGVLPQQINFIEAHGTGTPVGDPIEAEAINEILQVPERLSHCYLGAVKSNIGHLEAAAGVAGVIKTALCLKKGKIPPNLHCKETNRSIPFEKYCLKIPQNIEALDAAFASVNAFGYGGTNAHAVLQSYQKNTTDHTETTNFPLLFPLSSKSQEGLAETIKVFEKVIAENPTNDLAYTLTHHRTHFEYRAVISKGIVTGKVVGKDPKVAFVFTGMGPQWPEMGKELMKSSPIFAETFKKCDEILKSIVGWSLIEESSRMEDPVVAQVTNYALQVSLTALFESWGIRPDAIVGHSIGEVSAAYAAGCLTLEEGMYVAYHRSMIQSKQKDLGTLLAVGTRDILLKDGISIAAINSPNAMTLAGTKEDLTSIVEDLDKKNIYSRFVKVNIAYHSHQMEPLKEQVLEKLAGLSPNNANIPLYSTVTGNIFEDLHDAQYWWKNIRQSVEFNMAIQNMVKDGYQLFVEVGPHPVLATFIKENQGVPIQSLNRKKTEMDALLECVSNLYVNGSKLPLQPKGKFIRIPTYAWQKKKHWIESEESSHYRLSSEHHVMLSRKIKAPNPTWQVEVNTRFFPWVQDHKIENSIIFPAAGYIEAALAIYGQTPCILEEIKFLKPLVVDNESILQTSLNGKEFQIHSIVKDWTLHATGKCYSNTITPGKINLNLHGECIEGIYDQFAKQGLNYGPMFQGIKRLWKRGTEATSEIQVIDDSGYHLHPTLLDAALQTLIGTLNFEEALVLPFSIDRLSFYKAPVGIAYCHAKLTKITSDKIIGNLVLTDAEGNICVEVDGLTCRKLIAQQNIEFYEVEWVEKQLEVDQQPENLQIFYADHRSESDLVIACTDLVKSLENPTTLCIVTKDGYEGSSLWGFGRVVRQEYPHIQCKLIRTDDPELVLQESQNSDLEVCRKGGKRFVSKLKRKEVVAPKVILDSFSLQLKTPGNIANLYFQKLKQIPPKSNEVTIQIDMASLNFKDLMKVLGMLDKNVLEDTYFGNSFGMECSGTIVAVGSKVKNFSVGDKVCAFAPNTFQSYLNVSTKFISKLPEDPIYIPFVTVLRALKDVAQLKKGETILIHSATGAVGLAAIQYAKYVGANIIATVSNDDKRKYLKELGIEYCSNSRSLSFADDVLKWTNGRGVDVVLNSLAGDFLQKSWSLLAPYGRFIEIGKRDISINNNLPMQVFNQNTSFAAIDLDRTFVDNPKLIQKLIKQAATFFQKKIFTPLPCKIFSAAEVIDAFQYMARSHHIGKIMLKFHGETVMGVDHIINPEYSYLVTGGLSGFGLQTAQWLVDMGVKHLILIGRSGGKFKGAKIGKVDVIDYDSLEAFLKECENEMPPIKGIIHSAMVLQDGFISQLTPESINKVMNPKVQGCLNLHKLTLKYDLDFFVLYSSISSIIGNPGQGNYAAANAFLDAFSHYRRSLGLPSLTVNWGALKTGVLARNENVAKHLERSGITPMAPKLALEALQKGLSATQLGIFQVDWTKLPLQNTSMFSDFTNTSSVAKREYDFSTLNDMISEIIGKTLRIEPSKVDTNTKLNLLGVDSLMAMELQALLETNLGVKVPTIELMKGPTINQLTEFLLAR